MGIAMKNNKSQAIDDLHSIQATLAVLAELASLPNSNDVPIGLSDLATVLLPIKMDEILIGKLICHLVRPRKKQA